ncbi:uncharacterized protein LOC114457426 [Gouania willdenowi]|uniref:uncharacterized protein LOC114457426 n=1 Tax=Gouania willdenowi TaxID=441366 RepID=UPI0010561B55|nr:uncharacterized protein LOC114457426 [Gouania willdenowi]
MAAIELELGLEHGSRGWGQQRPELMDNFDSEMQEWEDQLQDIQRKIEELYHDVQARRGANETPTDNQKNGGPLDCELGYHGNCLFPPGHHRENHPGATNVQPHYSNGCNNGPNGYSYPGGHQNGYGYCHPNNVSEIENLLQDYLGKGKAISRKNNGVRHVHFSDTINVSQDAALQDKALRAFEDERLRQDKCLGGFEGTENKKNRGSHPKSSPCRESSPNKENTGAKPPLGQRDVSSTQARSQVPVITTESPALERKTFGPGVLGERKCNSPSVLRKFGAMLQENEGKTLTESGVVTNQGPTPEAKCPTPSCQRRALGATAVTGKVPMRVPTQRGQTDSEALTAEIEPGQEWGLALDSCRQNYKDQRGGYSCTKVSQPSPHQTQRRPQVAGSPKIRPRANSGADRDGGLPARKPVVQHMEPKMDYRVSSASPGAPRIQRGGLVERELLSSGQKMDEGLIELLDMLEIQHEYGSSSKTGYSSYKQEPQQVNQPKVMPAIPRKIFSRPARPANQRPPSRWASQTPSARIMAPSGPIYRPPSPRTRTPSPMTRTSSPALKQRPVISYSLQPETVIM